ncbi:type II secretion system protein [Bradyrhizobium erythrophlei]|uniref:Prepilin-type N-terminal cleavage/methylation domain-containing protein n=1 Tax=Bradyrhizobium erythrophlei TaxID=1437360 RepID=A0A1M7UY07_9BRAD|nr:prepilin-type N-terminal cleavage/methylation domain-containing protein [Bradyrhizobium erythrophlei]
MRSVLTGTPVVSRSGHNDGRDGQAGFTLLEALVALTLLVVFASAVGPHLSQARRIMANAEGRVAAQVLLRSLINAPVDRSSLAITSQEGETSGLRWRVDTEQAASVRRQDQSNWLTFRVVASVSWAPGQVIMAETIRLGKP